MACNYNEKDKDPSYNEFHNKAGIDRNQIQLEDSKKKTVEKIRNILISQFNDEISNKHHEISKIERRIHQNKMLLDRLRAYVVASYYGSGEKVIPVSKALPTRKRKKREKENELQTSIIPNKKLLDEKPQILKSNLLQFSSCLKDENEVIENNKDENNLEISSTNRFYVEKKIIVGNVSKYLLAETRKENDKSTHKWMVYVRGPAHDADISSYIKSVWFFLHPSYIPNDIIQINSPPFQLTRRGWGEFPIRVQLHFRDLRNKRFDIIHNLKLDKTYTGLQTLGAETIVTLELHRHASDNERLSEIHDKKLYENSSKQPIEVSICNKPGLVSSVSKTNSLNCISNFTNNVIISTNTALVSTNPPLNSNNLAPSHTLSKVSEFNSSNISLTKPANCLPTMNKNLSSNSFKNKQTFHITELDTISILHELIIDAPLISNKELKVNYFTCESYQKYASWSFSKRRACEWQRAIFMKKLFIEYKTVYSKPVIVPNTKQIMIWCRQYGHVPCEIDSKVIDINSVYSFCHSCGQLQTEIVKPINGNCCSKCSLNRIKETNTRSSFTTYINTLLDKEKSMQDTDKLKKNNDIGDCTFIDVLKNTNDVSDQASKKPLVEIASNIQLDWIYETVSTINIHLPLITINGIKAPVLHIMLRSAMKAFASELLRTSNFKATENNKTTLDPALITSNHVVEAVKIIPKFDFLTNINLAKEVQEIVNL
ncbi:YEATS domain-containing protein 2 [Hydra vulgaris]|uniref:YEATS domain-containing protein 2 n=1 Tax=Hydra vulgaris TaxID=6087 RepID=UPI001F5E752E|nr:YEATS domain-containing protein 2 [Hydra vulgaris]